MSNKIINFSLRGRTSNEIYGSHFFIHIWFQLNQIFILLLSSLDFQLKMQTRGKKVKESKRGKKQRLPRAPPLPTSGNELHGPEQEDFTQEIKEVDDTALVKACLASKDSHAKARVAMDALGDRRGSEPKPR